MANFSVLGMRPHPHAVCLWVDPRGEIASLKTYGSNFIHHDFVQFAKQHSRFPAHCFVTAVLQSILHLPYSTEAVMRFDYRILPKSSP